MNSLTPVKLNGHTAWVGPAFQVVPYEPEHMRVMALQPAQAHLGTLIDQGYDKTVAQGGPAWTALSSGIPIACCGFHEPWPRRAIAWAVLGDPGPDMLRLTRAVRKAFDAHPAERIEAYVRIGFAPGERWAELLGMHREGRMARFNQGADYWCFVRLKIALLCGEPQMPAGVNSGSVSA